MKATRLIIAALFAGALMVSCNKEIEQETVLVPNSPALRTECVISIDATKAVITKALAESSDGKTLTATWEDGDAVAVCRITGDASAPISEVIGKLTPMTTGAATTKLEGTIVTDGLAEGSYLYLQYPYRVSAPDMNDKIWLLSRYDGQDGTFATLAEKYDYATCGVQITAMDSETLSTSDAHFVSRQAVVKFAFKNSDGSAPLSLDRLWMASGSLANTFWHDEYYRTTGVIEVNAPAPASEFYIAMHKLNDWVIWMLGVNDDNVYAKRSPAVTFEDGKFYTGTIKMEPISYSNFTQDSEYSLIGEMSEYDNHWDKDLCMWTDGTGMHVAASVNLKAGDKVKFRTTGKWSGDEGGEDWGANLTKVPDVTWLTSDDAVIPEDGVYDLYLNLSGSGPNFIIVPASNAGKVSTVYEPAYTVAGAPEDIFGTFWDTTNTANDMIKQSDGTYLKTYTVSAATDFEFKVVKDHAYANGEWPASNYNISVPFPGTLYIKFDPAANSGYGEVTAWAEAQSYSLVGDFNGWDVTNDDYLMVRQSDGTYTYSCQVSPGQEYKVACNKDWSWNYGLNGYNDPTNFTYTGDGVLSLDLTFTFDPRTCTLTAEPTLFREELSDPYYQFIVYHGAVYGVVKMKDGKWWMAQNLAYLPAGFTVHTSLSDVTGGVFAPLEINPTNTSAQFTTDPFAIQALGYLYQAEVALGLNVGDLTTVEAAQALEGAQGICPPGWHVPTLTDINNLVGKANTVNNSSAPYYNGSNGSISLLNDDGFNADAFGAISIQDNTKTTGTFMGWSNKYPSKLSSGMFCGSTYAKVAYNTSSDPASGIKNLQFWGFMPMTNKDTEAEYTFNGTMVSYRIAAPLRCVRNPE